MGDSVQTWRDLYEEQIDLTDRVLSFVCRRNGIRGDEADELRSEVHLRLIDNDYAILRKFDDRSSLRTYLTVVIQRIVLDFRTERWGKWRPSEAARRLGDDAVLLETLMIRDGHDFSDAVAIMQTSMGIERSRDELYSMTLSFPLRWGRSSTTDVPLDDGLRSEHRDPERAAMDREVLDCERLLSEVLQREVESADPEDRALLRLVHLEGRKVSTIARMLQTDQQKIYRRMYALQKRLREALEQSGLDWSRASRVFESGAPQRKLDLERIFGRSPSFPTEVTASGMDHSEGKAAR